MADKKKSAREKTHTKIRQAIIRLENQRPSITEKGRKISVSSVAEEAGVSRALIHNDYPDLLERIRGKINKNIQNQRDIKQSLLKAERSKSKELRAIITELTEQRDILASKNATLILEIQELKQIIQSDNVTAFPNPV
jgi:AcrR family transcriptional regulator